MYHIGSLSVLLLYIKNLIGIGAIAHQLRQLTALAEDLDSIPSTSTLAHNSL